MGPVTLTYAAGLTSHENAGIERYYVTYLKSYEIIAETQPPDLMDLMDMRPDQAPEEDAALSETRMFATKIAHVIQFDTSIVTRMSEIRDNNNDKQKTEEQAFLDVLPNTKKENVWYLRVTTRYYRHLTEIQNTSPRIEPSPDEPHTPPSHTTCNALAVLVTSDTESRMNASVPDYLAPALDLL